MKITLKVNGVTRTLEAEPDMPLLWALRDFLSLKGAKYGCGIGACGACTVLVNGRAMRSCAVPLKALEGDEVRTIEGLGGNHPVQLGWPSTLPAPACRRSGLTDRQARRGSRCRWRR